MIVIRIQIQITKKKISKVTRRSSPRETSANGNKVLPFGWLRPIAAFVYSSRYPACLLDASRFFAQRLARKPHREERDRNRGGQVEAGDPLPHRDRDAGVGALEQLGADAVALGPEGEHGAGRQAIGVQV